MEILWNPANHTDTENVRWAYLRAIEWGSWPAFLGQAVGPILFLFLGWWQVAVAIVIADWLWILVRYAFVSPLLADMASYVTLAKWVTCPGMAVYFLVQHDWYMALISLLWPAIALLIDIPTPTTQIGRLQEMFLGSIGYHKRA